MVRKEGGKEGRKEGRKEWMAGWQGDRHNIESVGGY